MNTYDIAMYKILVLLDCWDINPSVKTEINNRKKTIMQQKIYLLKKLGFDMGFWFKWWNNPCDTNLYSYVKELHEKIDGNENAIPDTPLKDEVFKTCIAVNELPDKLKVNLDEYDKYILISSILFWSENADKSYRTPKGIRKKVKSVKPKFTKKQIKVAYKLADKMNLLKDWKAQEKIWKGI